jgi:hypothetical protein
MKTWLHFIGRSYYSTPTRFLREAQRLGVSRRISLQQARAMRYGDVVLLAQWDGKRQVAQVFGQFIVASLYGTGLGDLLQEEEREVVSATPVMVERECGHFTCGGIVTSQVDIPELLARVDESQPVNNLMVGGTLTRFAPYSLKDIHHRQGFREINAAELATAVAAGFQRAKCPVIRGQFYVWEEHAATPDILLPEERQAVESLIYEVEQYHRKA